MEREDDKQHSKAKSSPIVPYHYCSPNLDPDLLYIEDKEDGSKIVLNAQEWNDLVWFVEENITEFKEE